MENHRMDLQQNKTTFYLARSTHMSRRGDGLKQARMTSKIPKTTPVLLSVSVRHEFLEPVINAAIRKTNAMDFNQHAPLAWR
jgi:hypothetical protein